MARGLLLTEAVNKLMAHWRWLSFLFLLLSVTHCGTRSEEKQQVSDEFKASGTNFILNGTEVDPSEYPATGFIGAFIGEGGSPVRTCIGTKIRPNVIFTAAHCLHNPSLSQFFGLGNHPDSAELFEIIEVVDYDVEVPSFGDNDIGLARLGTCSEGEVAVPSQTLGLSDQDQYTFLSYFHSEGFKNLNGNRAKIESLRGTGITGASLITEHSIKDGCLQNGDSGGALYISGTNKIVGVLNGADTRVCHDKKPRNPRGCFQTN